MWNGFLCDDSTNMAKDQISTNGNDRLYSLDNTAAFRIDNQIPIILGTGAVTIISQPYIIIIYSLVKVGVIIIDMSTEACVSSICIV